MKKRLHLFDGTVTLAVRGTETERLLNACMRSELPLRNIWRAEDGSLRLEIAWEEVERFEKLARVSMCETERVSVRGGRESRKRLRRRSALGLLAALCALALTASSLFIWEIDILGNSSISEGEIRRALRECGVAEGCFWPATDVELIRSQMLLRLDQLSWMTLNLSGSRAQVVVLERERAPEMYEERTGADLVAACGGVVRDFSVKNGRTLIERGQIVTEGQTLVSAEMEGSGGSARTVRAAGSVTADTWREIRVQTNCGAVSKARGRGVFVTVGIQAGESRINLLSNGRKVLDECDRIVKEYKIGIKGLFCFPLKLVVEIYRPYESGDLIPADRDGCCDRAMAALADEIDGEILSSASTWQDGVLRLNAHCLENIALTKEIP